MTEQELRAIVRDAIGRHAASATATAPMPGDAVRSVQRAAPPRQPRAIGGIPFRHDAGGPCVIEPAVACNHCGNCKSTVRNFQVDSFSVTSKLEVTCDLKVDTCHLCRGPKSLTRRIPFFGPGDARGRVRRGSQRRPPALAGGAEEQARRQEGVVCLLTDVPTQSRMDAAPRLKVIANVAVGYNNIDVAAATARGIVVTNTPGSADRGNRRPCLGAHHGHHPPRQ